MLISVESLTKHLLCGGPAAGTAVLRKLYASKKYRSSYSRTYEIYNTRRFGNRQSCKHDYAN
jgi:hypothetical protein